MTYHVQSYMAFMSNELGRGLSHGIFFRTEPIFCTLMRIRMTINIDVVGLSLSLHRKSIFYFSSAKSGGFCEAPATKPVQNWTTQIFKNTRLHCMYKSLTACTSKLL
jgi:hypothetical protein